MNRLLVVDDDPAWRALYRMTFESQFEIFEAGDAQQALAAVGDVGPDVIVLDLRMPKMDGFAFLRRMGANGIRVPVVVCSGAFDDGEGLSVPGVRRAPKTPDLKDLRAALRAVAPSAAPSNGALDRSEGRLAVEETYWRD